MISKTFKVESKLADKNNENSLTLIAKNIDDESDWFEIHDLVYTSDDQLLYFSITDYQLNNGYKNE